MSVTVKVTIPVLEELLKLDADFCIKLSAACAKEIDKVATDNKDCVEWSRKQAGQLCAKWQDSEASVSSPDKGK